MICTIHQEEIQFHNYKSLVQILKLTVIEFFATNSNIIVIQQMCQHFFSIQKLIFDPLFKLTWIDTCFA